MMYTEDINCELFYSLKHVPLENKETEKDTLVVLARDCAS